MQLGETISKLDVLSNTKVEFAWFSFFFLSCQGKFLHGTRWKFNCVCNDQMEFLSSHSALPAILRNGHFHPDTGPKVVLNEGYNKAS